MNIRVYSRNWKSIVFIFLVIIISSCSKDDSNNGTGQIPSDFNNLFPLHQAFKINPVELELSWSESKDVEGPVTYDLYFGTTFPPPLLSKGMTITKYKFTTPLADSTKYYWKIKAKDNSGNGREMNYLSNHGYVCFTTRPKITSGALLTDSRDGITYKTIKIGTKTWMAENLKYNKPGSILYSRNGVLVDVNAYGRLYNLNAVKDSVNHLAPSGWHIPSEEELTEFKDYFPVIDVDITKFFQDMLPGGCGFNLQFGGHYYPTPNPAYPYWGYGFIDKYSNLWGYTPIGNKAYYLCFVTDAMNAMNSSLSLQFFDSSTDYHYSVRCIKD